MQWISIAESADVAAIYDSNRRTTVKVLRQKIPLPYMRINQALCWLFFAHMPLLLSACAFTPLNTSTTKEEICK